jgi:signal transduction histidine kinase
MSGVNFEITERKRIETELRRANHDLEQFAYSASHDLQEPLRSVKIFSELLSSRYGTQLDNEALEFLNNVRDGARRMEMLVHDLLAYSQASTSERATAAVDANAAMEAALGRKSGGAIGGPDVRRCPQMSGVSRFWLRCIHLPPSCEPSPSVSLLVTAVSCDNTS